MTRFRIFSLNISVCTNESIESNGYVELLNNSCLIMELESILNSH